MAVLTRKSVSPVAVVLTTGCLAVLFSWAVHVLNDQPGSNPSGAWLLVAVSFVAGFWMTRASSLIAGVALGAACGVLMALPQVFAGEANAVLQAVFGAFYGLGGGVVALFNRRVQQP